MGSNLWYKSILNRKNSVVENIKQSILSDSLYARSSCLNVMKKASNFGFSVAFWLGGLSSSTLMLLESWSILLNVRLIFDFSSIVKCFATPAKAVSCRDPSFFSFFARFIFDLLLEFMMPEMELRYAKNAW